jgi:hypothetical protein
MASRGPSRKRTRYRVSASSKHPGHLLRASPCRASGGSVNTYFTMTYSDLDSVFSARRHTWWNNLSYGAEIFPMFSLTKLLRAKSGTFNPPWRRRWSGSGASWRRRSTSAIKLTLATPRRAPMWRWRINRALLDCKTRNAECGMRNAEGKLVPAHYSCGDMFAAAVAICSLYLIASPIAAALCMAAAIYGYNDCIVKVENGSGG